MTRDAVGNPVRLDTVRGATTRSDAFAYDEADRLTAMCHQTTSCATATSKLSFSYDLVGNRLTTTKTGSGAFTETYRYDAAGQLSYSTGGPDGTVTYSYDADGNLTQSRGVTSSYDLDNHVTSVDDGTHRTAYTIDAAGDRTAADTTTADAPGRHTDYAWDDNNPLPMLVSERSTGDVRSYSYNPDGSPLALQTGGTGYLYQPDPFGNTAELTGTDGAVQREYTMTDPFGAFTETTPGGSTAPASRLGFDGQYQDPTTGTYHLRARDYSTTLGRFNSVDARSGSTTSPAESAYAYAHNNPLTGVDPSGEVTCIRLDDRDGPCASDTKAVSLYTGVQPPQLPILPTIPVLTINVKTRARGGISVAKLLQNSKSDKDVWIINGHLYNREELLDQVQGLGGPRQDIQLCEVAQCGVNMAMHPNGGHPCGYEPEHLVCSAMTVLAEEVGWIALVFGGIGEPGGGTGGGTGARTAGASGGRMPANNEQPGGAIQQSGPETCFAACGEMLTNGAVTQEQLIRELGDLGAASGDTARALPKGWQGGSVAGVADRDGVFRALNETGSWGAVVRGAKGGYHMVVVDGMTADGASVRIRDPYNGSSYETPYSEFINTWVGEAVFKP